MKANYLYSILGIVLIIGAGACKKLDLYPYDKIEVSQSFQSLSDAQSWDAGIMSKFRSVQYGYYTVYQDLAADQLNAVLDYGNNGGNPHRWDASFNNTDQVLNTLWLGYYQAIANANIAISGYPTIPVTSDADKDKLSKYLGSAHLARAYFYHALILRWAKPFEIATAASDPGVPLVLSYNVRELPARASVKAVYDQIIADLLKAQSLLSTNNTGTTAASRSTFSIDAVKALEARVRLCMHDDAGAYAAANTLITSGKYPLITTQSGFTAYWTNDTFGESILQLAASPLELPNINSSYLTYIPSNGKYNPPFVPSQWVVDTYASTDIRKSAYFKQLPVIVQGIDYPAIWCVTKYPGNPELFTSSVTNFANAVKTFRIGEMYCIAAEASIAIGNQGNARSAINTLRRARGLNDLSSGGTTLRDEIREERTRELAFEGFRLHDLARWHLGFTRRLPQNVNLLVQGSNYFNLSVAPDAPKFQWGIPSNDILINKSLTQNPGW